MSFSRKRQRFLVNQGYAYKVVTKLAGLEQDKELLYENREQQVWQCQNQIGSELDLEFQVTLLHQTLAANDADLEEEVLNASGKGTMRRTGNMASMSGADDNIYIEAKSRIKEKHPLFKRLRGLDK